MKARKKLTLTSPQGVDGDVQAAYAEAELRDDIEAGDLPDCDVKLPTKGMQLHSEYTLYGHFFILAQLFTGIDKVHFYLDQESGIRAACLSAFRERIAAREVDAFYVRINKNMAVNERRHAKALADAVFNKEKQRFPNLGNHEVALKLIQERIKEFSKIGKRNDKWLVHPFPNMSEPEKAVCCLVGTSQYAPEHIAKLSNELRCTG